MPTYYSFQKDKIWHYYVNQRADPPFLTIALQVNYNDARSGTEPKPNPAAEAWGRITVWHLKTTIPATFVGKTGHTLPKPLPSAPVFAGGMIWYIANQSYVVKTSSSTDSAPPPEATVHVPLVILQPPYRNLGISPLLWFTCYELASKNYAGQLGRWRAEKFAPVGASKQLVTSEPPVGTIEINVPSSEIKAHWASIGFNYMAKTHAAAFEFSPDAITFISEIADGKKNPATTKLINNLVQAEPNSIKAALDYMGDISKEGKKNWTRLAEFNG